jgi:serine/threonine protein kinase
LVLSFNHCFCASGSILAALPLFTEVRTSADTDSAMSIASDATSSASNPMHTSIILDNNTSGYLRRQGNSTIGAGLHRKRFYRLDGSVLTKQATANSAATWHANVLGASVVQHPKLCFSVTLKDRSTDSCEDTRLVLYAKTEKQCQQWVRCLDSAATRSLEKYYRIGEVIGEGGFASVRLGQCRATQRVVAIKTILKEQEYMQLYGREIDVIKRVDHPNIVRTFDLFETDKKIHIVMEYMSGGMLFEAIEDGVEFTEADVAQLMRELLHGLAYLHEKGIVHRDIKPENILRTDSQLPWHVKLSDFGLSKFSYNGAPSSDMLMKTIIGTPEFIAPEIAKNESYSSKVDLWAAGMLLYNCVCGVLPFAADEQDFVGQLRRGLDLTFPEEQWKKFSPEAQQFTKALLCPNPDRRLTALGALVHPWLDNELRFGSSRFSAHGRFSTRIPALAPAESGIRPIKSSPRKSHFFGDKKKKNPSWLVVFITVWAMNRFVRLIRPQLNQVLAGGPPRMGRLNGETQCSDLDTSDEEDSDLSPASVKSVSEANRESHSSFDDGGSSRGHNLGGMRSIDQGSKSTSTPESTPTGRAAPTTKRMNLGPRAASGLLVGTLRKASGLKASLQASGPSRKGSGIASILSMNKEACAPSRKESFRKLFKSGNGAGGDAMSATTAAAEFDQMLGFGELGVQTVDDGSVAGFGDSNELGDDGPASLLGAKHMKLAQSNKVLTPSPLAPLKTRQQPVATERALTGYKSRLQDASPTVASTSIAKRSNGGSSSSYSTSGSDRSDISIS